MSEKNSNQKNDILNYIKMTLKQLDKRNKMNNKLQKENEILKNKLNISLSKKFEKIAKRPDLTIKESEFEKPSTKFVENKFPKKISTKPNLETIKVTKFLDKISIKPDLETIEETEGEITIPPIRRKRNVRKMID